MEHWNDRQHDISLAHTKHIGTHLSQRVERERTVRVDNAFRPASGT